MMRGKGEAAREGPKKKRIVMPRERRHDPSFSAG